MPRIFRLLAAFVLAHGLAVRADTLSLRNGTTVTGSWAGADAGQIRFLVDNQIRAYPRSDVSTVIFGDEQPKSQGAPPVQISIGMSMDEAMSALGQPDRIADLGSRKIYFYKDRKVTFVDGKVSEVSAVPASDAEPAVGAPTGKVVEPELIGAVYLQDASGKLIPLMRIEGQFNTPRAPFGIKVAKPRVEFHPTPSTVRVKSGQKLIFVVKLANGIDPGSLNLLAMKIAKAGDKPAPPPMHFNIAKFGESSYALTVTSDLVPGEYGFHGHESNDLYCFGVDAEAEAKVPAGVVGGKDGEK